MIPPIGMPNRGFHSPFVFAGAVLIILGLSCGGAATEPTDPTGEPVGGADYQGLVNLFLAEGLDVDEIGIVDLPCFGEPATVLLVAGGTVAVYEYSERTLKIKARAKIMPDYLSQEGLPPDIVERFSQAHFYESDTLLVHYSGASPTVERLLESALGAEFADGNSVFRC